MPLSPSQGFQYLIYISIILRFSSIYFVFPNEASITYSNRYFQAEQQQIYKSVMRVCIWKKKKSSGQVAQVHISPDKSVFKSLQQELINSIRIYISNNILVIFLVIQLIYVNSVTSPGTCTFINSTIMYLYGTTSLMLRILFKYTSY